MYTGKSNLPETITGNPLEFKSLKYEEDYSNQGKIKEIIDNPIIKWITESITNTVIFIIGSVFAGLILIWVKPKIFKN